VSTRATPAYVRDSNTGWHPGSLSLYVRPPSETDSGKQRMPSIPWSKRPAFGRQTSEPSNQLGVETAPEDVGPHSDGAPGGVPDQTHPQRGSKRGFIQSLLGRAQSHSRSKAPAGPNTTSERKWE